MCGKDVETETAQACEHAGVGADARAVFAEGDVAAVVGGGFDPPVCADGIGGAACGDRRVGDIEGGFGGVAQQPGLAAAGEHLALDADDGGDVGMPVGVGEYVGGIKDGDGAALVAIAPDIVAVGGSERWRGGGEFGDLAQQGGLVVLDLDDQGEVGLRSGLEGFFWQCSASRVTTAPAGTPSSASSAWAAGISLDFSAISTWASTRAVSVANALSTWAAARS